jgi:hypothetical protein
MEVCKCSVTMRHSPLSQPAMLPITLTSEHTAHSRDLASLQYPLGRKGHPKIESTIGSD